MSTTPKPFGSEVDALALPLCVDLDGTLVRTDTLIESLSELVADPRFWRALLMLPRGLAAFKQAVAEAMPVDPLLLPYNGELLTYLKQQKEHGRYLVLATASNQRTAEAIARYLGIFDEVIASDGTRNLKGAAKARSLTERFGIKGFSYAGNASSDLKVWEQSASVIAVNAPKLVLARLRGMTVEKVIEDRPPLPREILRAMRPHQWVKNLLVFVPILTAHALTETSAWIGGTFMFLAFCCAASGIYIINDLFDIRADRAHVMKRLRPFARGSVPVELGILVALGLLSASLMLSWIGQTVLIVTCYAAMSIAYSAVLKQLPLVDVFMLAALYVIRLLGGGEATGHRLSLWLLGFSSFLFLSLALLKRVEETMGLKHVPGGKSARRGYTASDAPILQLFGVASAFASSIVLALFVQTEATLRIYASPGLLWLVVPLMLFWQCRMWLSGSRGYMHHDPIVYAARDRISWIIGATTAAVLIAAKSLPIFAG